MPPPPRGSSHPFDLPQHLPYVPNMKPGTRPIRSTSSPQEGSDARTPSANPPNPRPGAWAPEAAGAIAIRRGLKKSRPRLRRKLEGVRGDLAEARRGGEYRRYGEALLALLHEVP